MRRWIAALAFAACLIASAEAQTPMAPCIAITGGGCTFVSAAAPLPTSDVNAVAQGSTTAAQSGPLMQGSVATAGPTYVTGQTSPLSLTTTGGALRVGLISPNGTAVLAASNAADGAATGVGLSANAFLQVFNGTTFDRARSAANFGATGKLAVQSEEGYSSSLNVTAATTVKATAGRVFKLNVIVAGATGQVCDNNAACAAANVVFQIPATVGTYDLNWPMATGIRVEPGAAQVVAVSWN